LATVEHREEAITLTGRFLQYYRENAKWLERTYDFVARIELAELQAILVGDRDGIAGRLDEAIQQSIDAYRDPWQEHRHPVTEGQFRNALPLVELPKVPIR
jgi:nitrite reductase (NADH) large subunit